MFEIGDFVVKANNGICRVDNIGHLDISSVNKDRLYFFLTPLNASGTKLYVPADKEDNGLRKVITKDEALEFIDNIPKIDEARIADEKQREQKYKEAIQSCDPKMLMGIIKSIYARMQKRMVQGKKNTSIDEHFFKIAENNLYTEIAFAVGKKKEDVQNIIFEKIEEKNS